MAMKLPYVYISCPCSEASNKPQRPNRYSQETPQNANDPEDEETTFNPHHRRSNFSLFPLEHLLYCEECHDIKCPRCVSEEIVVYFCPNCMFETPNSMVRSEGNRCARNCFNCPICTSVMTTSPMTEGNDTYYILNCNYCMWTTLDIGIKFDKPTGIRSQLDRIANGGKPKPSSRSDHDATRKSSLAREPFSPSGVPFSELSASKSPEEHDSTVSKASSDPHTRFSTLKAFYKEQISLSAGGDSEPGSINLTGGYASPSSLARIMSMYSNQSSSSALAAASFLKKSRQKPQPMREALTPSEGLLLSPPFSNPTTSPFPTAYSSTLTPAQRLLQHTGMGLGHPSARDVSSLRPIPVLLRTKRSKRCQTCKHILVKPEVKPTSTRYRIRLLAASYVPHVTLRPLPSPSTISSSKPSLKSPLPTSISNSPQTTITPNKPTQFILRLTNPLFDRVKVRLGCPATLPSKPAKPYSNHRRGSRHRSADRVTILCPQFEIGANSDVWDDALNNNYQFFHYRIADEEGYNLLNSRRFGGRDSRRASRRQIVRVRTKLGRRRD